MSNTDKSTPLVVIGYYTDDPVYRQHFDILRWCLDKYGITHDYTKIPVSNWLAATAYKPTLILEKIKKHEHPVLYLDVDCFVHQDITGYFGKIEEDLGTHVLEATNELVSSTLYFKFNANTVDLLEKWIQGMRENPTVWDQQVLQGIIDRKEVKDLRVRQIEPEYLYVFDLSKAAHPHLKPVIEQLQASREMRYIARTRTFKARLLSCVGIRRKIGKKLAARRARMNEIMEFISRSQGGEQSVRRPAAE
jgi:hypothetical protein